MMQGLRAKGPILATAALLATISFGGPSVACSLVRYADNGRYVGGDLVTQIAAKADLIQLVRVTEKRVVTRTYSLGSWYLQFGDTDVPDHQPEYIDQFVFTLEAVESLKGTLDAEPGLIEPTPRVLGYDRSVFASAAYPVSPEGRLHPNSLPAWVFDQPADGGYAFLGASEDAGLGGGECFSPYFLEVGQLFVALRMSDGRLYPPGGGFPLEIDVELRPQQGLRRRQSINMQSLIPIASTDDPLVGGLRQAITSIE